MGDPTKELICERILNVSGDENVTVSIFFGNVDFHKMSISMDILRKIMKIKKINSFHLK